MMEATNEWREAMLTFGICFLLTGGVAVWWSVIYWNIEIRRVVRGSKETLEYIQEQEKYH